MRKVLAAVVTVLVAGAILYKGRSSGPDVPAATLFPSPAYELLTILGDVRSRPGDAPGRWRKAAGSATVDAPGRGEDGAPAGGENEELSDLMALPYLQGSKAAPNVSNVTRYDTDRAGNGLNLYTSGHAPEAFLMDMNGKVVHRWQYAVEDIWPTVPRTIHSTFWRRVHAYPNGDLLAIFEGIGMIKLDRYSRLLWAYHGGCHHQAVVTDSGEIYVLTRRAQIVPRIKTGEPVLPDAVAILSADGELRREYSLLECFENSSYRGLLENMRPRGDLFHTNSIEVFDGSMADFSPFFKKGNVLISSLKLDTIAIVDLKKGEVVWAKSGREGALWKRQHDPTVLPNGNIMLFDNQGRGGQSRVVEFDIRRSRIVWQYAGDATSPLFSKTCGLSQRLPNGNFLITESDNGRAIEITPGKDVVWEFYNPHRAGENNELIATLFELDRFEADYFSWLQAKY